MSLSNLLKPNNYKLFIGEIEIQNIVADNLTVVDVLTAQTIESVNVNTTNLASANGVITDLTVSDTLTAATGVITDLTAQNANLTNLTVTDATIDNLTLDNITIDNITVDNITVTDTLTAANGNINSLTSAIGVIGDLTVTNGLTSQIATFENLGVTDTLTSLNTNTTNFSADVGVIDSLTALTTFNANNIAASGAISGSTLTSVGSVIGTTLAASTSMTSPTVTAATSVTSPLLAADNITTASGSGSVTFNQPIQLPLGTPLGIYSSALIGMNITGARTTTANVRATRIGAMVTFFIVGFSGGAVTAAASAPLIYTGLSAEYRPTTQPFVGICAVQTLIGTIQQARITVGLDGVITIYADLLGSSFVLGDNCGLNAGGIGGAQSFSFVRNE